MSLLLQAGLNVTVIGMGVVFVLLTALVFIIKGMSAIAHRLGGSPAAAQAAAGGTALAAAETAQDELVSVISAAIAMHRRRR